jgi:hypothetical protein
MTAINQTTSNRTNPITKGTTLILRAGYYEDFDMHPLRVIEDFDMDAVTEDYAKAAPTNDNGQPEATPFHQWLIESGYAIPVPQLSVWHIGDDWDGFAPYTRTLD